MISNGLAQYTEYTIRRSGTCILALVLNVRDSSPELLSISAFAALKSFATNRTARSNR